MNIRRKVGMILITLCMCLGLVNADVTVWAASGKTSVSVSASSVNIGDTVTVTGKASGASGEKVLATMTLSWDANVLQFVSCSTDSNGGGGSRMVNGDNFTITLKAISAGTSAVSLSATDGVLFDTVESLDSMAGSSTSVTVNNAVSDSNAGAGGSTAGGGTAGGATAGGSAAGGDTAAGSDNSAGQNLSADNSLKSLTISPGTLSPAFSYKTTSYTATVGSDVTSIAVSAVPSNDKAVVESVTGNDKLQDGTNTIKIVVKAENGVTATYTIKVTKQAGTGNAPSEPEEGQDDNETADGTANDTVAVNGVNYRISEGFKEENIPADFGNSIITYHENAYQGVSFTKGSLKLLWMVPQDAEDSGDNGRFFVYDETRDSVYPFVRFLNGKKYVIALMAPVDFTMPETYLQTSLEVGAGNVVSAYQKTSDEESEIASEFYVFYGVNDEGTENWYQYDAREGTHQRLPAGITDTDAAASSDEFTYLQEEYTALSEEYKDAKESARTQLAILIFVIVVLVIIIINLLIHRFGKHEDDDFYDDDLTDDGLEEDDVPEKDVSIRSPLERAFALDNEIGGEDGVMQEEPVDDMDETPEEADVDDEDRGLRSGRKLGRKHKKEEPAESDDLEIIDFNDL